MQSEKLAKFLNLAKSSGVSALVDRRTVGGIVVGASLVMTGYAVSSTSGGYAQPSSELLSQQAGAVDASIKSQLKDCSTQKAIDSALKAHSEIASAGPEVEKLFDTASDCFSSITQLNDLSDSIPSLDSIMGKAKDAVLRYAQKKVCSAVREYSSMVTGPLNKAITTVNNINGLEGIVDASISTGMKTVDPQLGQNYYTSSGGSYTLSTNPFGINQTSFSSGGSSGGSTAISGYNAQITQLTTQIGAAQAKVGPAELAVQRAQANLASCTGSYAYAGIGGSGADCSSYQQALTTAQSNLTSINTQLSALQGLLRNVVASQAESGGASSGASTASVTSSASALFN